MTSGTGSPPSLWHRWKRRFQNRFRARTLEDAEWRFTYDLDVPEITAYFFVERRVLEYRILVPGLTDLALASLKVRVGDDLVPCGCRANIAATPEGLVIQVVPDHVVPVTKAVLTFEDAQGKAENPLVRIQVTNDIPPDLFLLRGGLRCAQDPDRHDAALEYLLDYQDISIQNPQVAYALSRVYQGRNRQEDAENAALRALVNLPSDYFAEHYRNIRLRREPTPAETIRKVQEDAAGWTLEPHHGLVVLLRENRFRLGLNGWHLKAGRELVEVRRPAAGRFLKSLGFPLSTNEYILATQLRVVHPDGKVEAVNDENFTVTDSSEKNVFITVEQEKTGLWILPDLSPGDVVEFTYELICRNNDPEGEDEIFILSFLFDSQLPTHRGVSTFLAPPDLPVRFATRNGDFPPRREDLPDEKLVRFEFEGTRHIPAKNTNFPYENAYLNPLIACSREGAAWSRVLEKAREVNFGDDGGEAGGGEELPPPLDGFVAGEDGDGAAALEQAFYWIRDKLKYASLKSGLEHIGRTTRAARIVESGMGDCKDKSFLLGMVCRKLGLPYEYVMISTKNGLLIEELPANQFDHVFIRARSAGDTRASGAGGAVRAASADGWLYMDAANSMSLFGSPPAWCQGMEAMALTDAGTPVTIPLDDPEVNGLIVTETFHTADTGWLEGTFDFQARGYSGRLANERAKGLSLYLGDPRQAIQEGLGPYLSFLVVDEHSRISDTGDSGLFHVTGRHRRSPLVPLGRNPRQVGRLTWNAPGLPLGYWRNLPLDRLFVLDYPIHIAIRVTLEGALRRRLDDLSRVHDLENDLCRITETVAETETEAGPAVTIRRDIVFGKRFVRGPGLARVAASMEALEKALVLVVSLNEPAPEPDQPRRPS